eukprot:Skav236131  [mRNA]  locus=scaffold3100:84117:92651:- [translate_table: standard]
MREVMRAYSGDSHHMYRVVPEIPMCCGKPHLQVPCADSKSKCRTYYPGDVLGVLSNGSYRRATFARVDDRFFPPKAEFQAVLGHREPCAHGTPLLHVESGQESWLLSAAEMYDECHCTVAPADFIGFAPASWHDIIRNLRTQVAAPPPTALEPNQPSVAGGQRGASAAALAELRHALRGRHRDLCRAGSRELAETLRPTRGHSAAAAAWWDAPGDVDVGTAGLEAVRDWLREHGRTEERAVKAEVASHGSDDEDVVSVDSEDLDDELIDALLEVIGKGGGPGMAREVTHATRFVVGAAERRATLRGSHERFADGLTTSQMACR